VQMKAEVLNLQDAKIFSSTDLKKTVEAFIGFFFTDDTLHSDTINIGMEVATLLKAGGSSVPSWLEGTGTIDISDVSNTGAVCDSTPRKFAVNVTGLTVDDLKTNVKSVGQALAT